MKIIIRISQIILYPLITAFAFGSETTADFTVSAVVASSASIDPTISTVASDTSINNITVNSNTAIDPVMTMTATEGHTTGYTLWF